MLNTAKYLHTDTSYVETIMSAGRKCSKCGVDSNTVSINSTMPARFFCIEHINLEVDDVMTASEESNYDDEVEAE